MENYILYVLDKIEQINQGPPCKKKVQKIVYLIENSGSKLGYKYGIHLYGPYSAALDQEITNLIWNRQIEISYESMSHFLKRSDKEIKENRLPGDKNEKIIDAIIAKYALRTPSDLELITTTLYVMQNVSMIEKEVIKLVKEIKGTKYTDIEILKAYEELKSDDYIIKIQH